MNNEPIKDGGPAFPTQDYDRGAAQAGFAVTVTDNPGMSLRDWFAGQALNGYVAYHPASIMGPFVEETAVLAYQYANAMIKAREGKL